MSPDICPLCDARSPRVTRIDIPVPTEDGKTCVVDLHFRPDYDQFWFGVSGELLGAHPEAIHATVSLAIMRAREAMAAQRRQP